MRINKIIMRNLLLYGAMYVLTLLQCNAQNADHVFLNGSIYTAVQGQGFAEAMAVKDGKIIYVGINSGANVLIDGNTVVEDLNGRVVLPGLHDVHMHPLEAGSPIGGDCFLDGSEEDPEALGQTLASCDLQPNSNGWITAFGHCIYTLLDAQRPPREILDDVDANIPIAVMEETSHSFWLNSKALEMAGIDAYTPSPVGGFISIDPYTGEPDGILYDNAGDIVIQMALASNATIDGQNFDGIVEYSLPLLARLGITSFCEARTYYKRNYHQIWKDIKSEGLLTARVVLSPWVYPEDDDATLISTLQGLYDEGDDLLKTTHLKLYSDGITINATAALEEPYLFNLGHPFDRGLNYIDVNRLTNLITQLETIGYDFHIHAIGDRGIREGLDAIEAARQMNGDVGARHRITHLEIVDPDDYDRFAALNVTADMQVAGEFANPGSWHENDFLIGAQRSNNLVPLRSIYETGARVTLSSDWDVSSPNPFVGMQNALTRAPQQLPDISTAVDAYTINAAYVMGHDDITGSLTAGRYADFICIDQDIFNIPKDQIKNTKILSTWLAGKEIYRSTDLPTSTQTSTGLPKTISVAPNPTHSMIEVKLGGLPVDSVGLYTLKGRKILNSAVDETNNDYVEIDASNIPAGVYILKLMNQGSIVGTVKVFRL